MVYCAVEESCPGLFLERQPLSALDLRQQVAAPFALSTTDIFLAHLDGKNKVLSRLMPLSCTIGFSAKHMNYCVTLHWDIFLERIQKMGSTNIRTFKWNVIEKI